MQPPAAGTPPRKRSKLLPCGCAAVAGLAVLACVATVAITQWQEANTFRDGMAAFNQGDCRGAIEHFDVVLESSTDVNDSDATAELMRTECLTFQAAVDAEEQGEPGQALARYLDFAAVHPDSGLANFLPERVAALFDQASAAELAVPEACDRVGLLGEADLLPKLDDQLPEILFACGQTYEALGQLEDALAMYTLVSANHPDHSLAEDAGGRTADVRIAIARRDGAGDIAAPTESGSAPAGTAVYIVRNDSPELIRITLSGPQVVVDEVAACGDCSSFSEAPDGCPDQGPIVRYTLEPGVYEVLVEAVGADRVTPYVGSWDFQDQTEYSDCYYIVTTVVP